MTQKDVAVKLYITEQAVSKWERGLSYPDISILPKLAEILDISVEELLYGKLRAATNQESDLETKDIVTTLKEDRRKNTKKIFFSILSIVFLVALCTVIIINIATSGGLTWSLFVIGGEILVYLTLLPVFFLNGEKRIYLSIIVFTIISILYSFYIGYLTKTTFWLQSLVLPILLLMVFFAVFTIFIIRRLSPNTTFSLGIVFFL